MAVDESRPPFDDEPRPHLVEDADGLEHAQARRQERLTQVKPRVPVSLEDEDVPPELREPRRAN